MRKLFSLFVALITTTTLWAYDFKYGDLYYNITSDTTVEVTYQNLWDPYNYDGLTSVVIPNSVKYGGSTYKVISIGDNAFTWCSRISSVTIPNSVINIGKEAFYSCSSSTSITIPNSVTSIGLRAFSSCESLTSVTIPNGVTSIEDEAFCYCASLTSISIPESVKSIGDEAFYYCASLPSITIPNSVTSIGYAAFAYCSSLTSVLWNAKNIRDFDKYSNNPFYHIRSQITSFEFGNDVEHIPAFLCYKMENLSSIIFGENITSIGTEAFYDTSWLKNLPNGLIYIGKILYKYVGEMPANTSIHIKEGTVSIHGHAFESCAGLVSITIPESLTSIGDYAFSGCSSLTKTNYTGDVASWCNIKFDDVYNNPIYFSGNFYINDELVKDLVIPNTVDSIHNYAFYYCSSITSVTIPNSVTNIGDEAFSYCSNLTSVIIGNSVTSIGDAAFRSCSSLTKTNYTGDVASWCNIKFDDVYSNPIYFSGNFYINDELVKDLVIPNTVDSIHNYAFCYCSSITSVTIPNSVTNIGDYAFFGCDKTTSVTIPNSVTSIGSYAFAYCGSLTSVTIPNSVTSIGENTFNYCSSLISITIPNSVTSIGNGAFQDCRSLASFTIPNNIVRIEEKTFQNCESLFSITIPKSLKYVYKDAFTDCDALEKVNYLGDIADWCKIQFADASANPFQMRKSYNNYYSMTILYLNDQPFDGIFPNNVDTISDYAFCGASFDYKYTDQSITIGDNVKYIGNYAFEGSTDLEDVYLPTTPPKLGRNVFTCRQYSLLGISYFFIPCGLEKIYKESDWKNYTNGNTKFSSYTKLMYSGYCGDSLNLSWSYSAEKLTITGTGEYHPSWGLCTPWELLIDSIKTLEIGQGITSISDDAFDDLINLNTLILPNSIEKIGAKAFNTCKKLYDIYCYAQFPPETSNNTFVNYNAFLHVPCDYQRYYTADMVFSKFINVECISAETISTDSIIVSPSFNDVVFTWPTESNAGSYTLIINKGGEVFCTLTFNAAGQLTGIAFAPSRNGQRHAPAATQAANGFTFTVTGLDEGTDYSYNLVIKDNSGKILQTYSGEFRTQSTNDRTVTVEYDAAQGQVTGAGTYLVGDTVTLTATPNDGYRFVRWSNEVEDNPYTFVISDNVTLSAEFEAVIHSDVENTTPSQQSDTHKLLRNGQLLIIRDGKTYNAMGQEI